MIDISPSNRCCVRGFNLTASKKRFNYIGRADVSFHGTVCERGFEWAGSALPWSAQGLSGDNQTAGGELNRAMCQKIRSEDVGYKLKQPLS